jgi:hypothetical protein
VDDGMVLKSMKELWEIPTPAPGKGYIHGLKSHTWQALALATKYSAANATFGLEFPKTSQEPPFFAESGA